MKNNITKNKYYFLHISSSYAKILGETNFPPQEISRRGSKAKAKDGKERKREKTLQGLGVAQAAMTERWP